MLVCLALKPLTVTHLLYSFLTSRPSSFFFCISPSCLSRKRKQKDFPSSREMRVLEVESRGHPFWAIELPDHEHQQEHPQASLEGHEVQILQVGAEGSMLRGGAKQCPGKLVLWTLDGQGSQRQEGHAMTWSLCTGPCGLKVVLVPDTGMKGSRVRRIRGQLRPAGLACQGCGLSSRHPARPWFSCLPAGL